MNGGAGLKEGRQRRIVRLLEERPVASQNELAVLLRAAGYRATQATVSRDLEELGVVKVRRDGHTVYALPGAVAVGGPDARLRSLGVSVRSLEASGNLLVVRTPPGHAQMVALALDQAELSGVAGTVAGDDTILVVVREGHTAGAVDRALRALVGLPPPNSPGRRAPAPTGSSRPRK